MIRLSKCSIDETDYDSVAGALRSEYLGMGPLTIEFEQKLALFLNCDPENLCTVNTGTSALHAAIESLRLPKPSKIAVPNITYVASLQSILMSGHEPVIVDVDPKTLEVSSETISHLNGSGVVALIHVHHSGKIVNYENIADACKYAGITLINDAAQSFGSYYLKDNRIPNDNSIVCFSFDGIKNITCGEGGAVFSNNVDFINWIKDFRLLGVQNDTLARSRGDRSFQFNVKDTGFRYHLSSINAALGLSQLARFDFFAKKRLELVAEYEKQLVMLDKVQSLYHPQCTACPHIYVIWCENRNELRDFLNKNDVQTGIHYQPLSYLDVSNTNSDFPNSEKVFQHILTLPLHVDLDAVEVTKICELIRLFYSS